jgi:hypothetical protein
MRDHERFRSDWGPRARFPLTSRERGRCPTKPSAPTPTSVLPIEVDPPEHRAYRQILHAMFAAPISWTNGVVRVLHSVPLRFARS